MNNINEVEDAKIILILGKFLFDMYYAALPLSTFTAQIFVKKKKSKELINNLIFLGVNHLNF